MKSIRKYPFAYLSALCFLLAGGFFFLPLVYVETAFNEMEFFSGLIIGYGGQRIMSAESGQYVFDFSINIPVIVLSQVMVLGFISAFLSKDGVLNKVINIFFSFASLVIFLIMPVLASANSSLTMDGTHYAYGCGLCILSCSLALLFDVLALAYRPKKPIPAPKKRRPI